jgi:hypothetical protein
MMLGTCPRLAAILGAVVAMGCRGPECTVSTTQYSTSVSALGYNGPTQGVPVARFNLTQDFISHTPYAACTEGPLQDVGVIRATVTNISSVPLLLTFDLQGLNASGIMVWDQVRTVERIMPNETVDLGDVSVSPTHVDLGAKVVFTAVTVLP